MIDSRVQDESVQELNGTTPTANLLTGGVDERFTRTDANGTLNYITGALGSTVALTDNSGNSQAQYSYDPYGSMNATGSTTNSYTYTGREFDGLGLYYYRARYYDPATGRFISEDPIGLNGGINKYAYVGNDPVDYFDPLGLDKNSPSSSCNALTAALTQAVAQITDSGEAAELAGLELSELSAVSIAFAPEGLLIEGGGIEMGISMMELGAQVAAVGEGLETYVRTGNVLTAGAAVGADAFANAAISALVKEALPGVAQFFQSAIVTVLGEIPGMIAKEENTCGGS